MTARTPLVLGADGIPQQLQSGDVLTNNAASANSVLLGSGALGSGAPYVELSLGSNLSMSGNTLNAAGGGTSDNSATHMLFGGL